MIDDVIEYGSKLDAWTKATLLGRDVVPPGTGNWRDFYAGIAASADTLTVMNGERYLGTFTAAAVESMFSTNKVNVLLKDLYGCTSLRREVGVINRLCCILRCRSTISLKTVTTACSVLSGFDCNMRSCDQVARVSA